MKRKSSRLLLVALCAFAAHASLAQQGNPSGAFLHSDKGMRSLKSASGPEFEKRFLSQTIEHHRGSIELSQRALRIAMPDEMKTRARTIIKRAEHEIRLLRTWLLDWYKVAPLESEEHLVRGDMAERMSRPILTQKDYVNQMVGHEEEEVQMGQFVAKRSVHRRLRDMAAKMVSHSEQDILYLLKTLRSDAK